MHLLSLAFKTLVAIRADFLVSATFPPCAGNSSLLYSALLHSSAFTPAPAWVHHRVMDRVMDTVGGIPLPSMLFSPNPRG